MRVCQTIFNHSFATVVLLLCIGSQAATITGTVVKVADGDTITLRDSNHIRHKIRLSGVDAPEKSQPYGKRSQKSLSDLVFGKIVRVDTYKADRFGRELGKVLFKGQDVNLEQLKRGLAWHYKAFELEQTPEDRRIYGSAENDAASARLGLWQDPAPVPPWEWRRRAKNPKSRQQKGLQ